jgi:hypothetical protein
MMLLPKAIASWGGADFPAALAREIEQLDPYLLPLQQGLSATSVAVPEGFKVIFLGAEEAGAAIHARVGIFYAGIIAGCSCADDPTPVEPQTEYCELRFEIDRASGQAMVYLLA